MMRTYALVARPLLTVSLLDLTLPISGFRYARISANAGGLLLGSGTRSDPVNVGAAGTGTITGTNTSSETSGPRAVLQEVEENTSDGEDLLDL